MSPVVAFEFTLRLAERYRDEAEVRVANRKEHYEVVLAAVAAGARGDLEAAPIGDDPR